jgi:hypothetical protein
MRKTLESPVQTERCTPGLGMWWVKTAESNLGMASPINIHLKNRAGVENHD